MLLPYMPQSLDGSDETSHLCYETSFPAGGMCTGSNAWGNPVLAGSPRDEGKGVSIGIVCLRFNPDMGLQERGNGPQ